MPMLLQDRDVQGEVATRRRRPRGRRLLAAGVGVALAVPLAGLAVDRFTGWDPLGQEVVDRSTTPLLLALDDLHEYHAATGTFQVVIDQERDTPHVPSVISGERTTLLATGTVDAYVDLEDLGADRVTLSADGGSATIVLPAPRLAEPRVDPTESRVLDRDRGLLERVGDAIEDDPVDDSALYAEAEQRLAAAAAESDLQDRAEDNTRTMLTTLAGSLGVEDVTVTFEPAPGAAG
ncbi:DUF4230 domain-containing protein [Modestobacter marinus]|uniref:DUF4230 domain-containing protein n=1 Tax=Modestobacter marinus TaxID=477641 RepID=UPI001C96A43A|nr:DUF4230 domain-containing protein [Modestobacter marinus]